MGKEHTPDGVARKLPHRYQTINFVPYKTIENVAKWARRSEHGIEKHAKTSAKSTQPLIMLRVNEGERERVKRTGGWYETQGRVSRFIATAQQPNHVPNSLNDDCFFSYLACQVNSMCIPSKWHFYSIALFSFAFTHSLPFLVEWFAPIAYKTRPILYIWIRCVCIYIYILKHSNEHRYGNVSIE